MDENPKLKILFEKAVDKNKKQERDLWEQLLADEKIVRLMQLKKSEAPLETLDESFDTFLRKSRKNYATTAERIDIINSWMEKVEKKHTIDLPRLPALNHIPEIQLIKLLQRGDDENLIGMTDEELAEAMYLTADSIANYRKKAEEKFGEKFDYIIDEDNRSVGDPRSPRRRIRNTIHPIGVAFNMYQVTALMRSLLLAYRHQEYDENLIIPLSQKVIISIAAQIWDNITEYGKQECLRHSSLIEKDFPAFIHEIEKYGQTEPANHRLTRMLEENDKDLRFTIDFAFKSEKTCRVKFADGTEGDYKLFYDCQSDKARYKFIPVLARANGTGSLDTDSSRLIDVEDLSSQIIYIVLKNKSQK